MYNFNGKTLEKGFHRANTTINISFVVLVFFFFYAALHGMWDLSSPTRDQTHIPCIGSAVS